MKMLITLDFPPEKGGIQTYLRNIVFYSYGKEDIVLVGAGGKQSASAVHLKTRVRYYKTPFSFLNKKVSLLALVVPYIWYCNKNKSSLLVECGNVYAAVVPWIVRRVTRQPYSIYTYGTELVALRKRSIKNYFLKKVLSEASALYTLGSYSEDLLKLLEAQQPVSIVPPKIVLSQRKLQVKSPSPGATRVLSIGRLVKHKGFAVLIHAAAALRRKMNVTVTIIGNGPDYSRLTDLCRDLGVAQCVFIKRNVSDADLEKEFQSADLFVLPSMETEQGTEGFGIVLLEAMAYHIPVIASACGGIPEVLENGNAGVLVQPGNSDALAWAIESLAKDQDGAEQLAARAYSRLLEYYVWR